MTTATSRRTPNHRSARFKAGQKLRGVIRSSTGAIDLASIMVGVLVIGIIAAAISATMFAVIPWSQNQAAKASLHAVQTAESVHYAASNPPSYANLATLQAPTVFALGGGAGGGIASMSVGGSGTPLLPKTDQPLVINATASGYVAAIRSDTGTLYYAMSGSPDIYTGATLPSTLPDSLVAPALPTISGSLPDATTGATYSQTIPSTGADSFTVTSGSLPTGLSLAKSTGAISGTPTETTSSTFTVTASNALGSVQHAFSIRVTAPGEMAFSWNAALPACQSVSLPMGGKVSATIDWGDGSAATTATAAAPTHTYADTATHSVVVTGSFTSWNNPSGTDCITSISAWHGTGTTDMSKAFMYAKNLTSVAEIPSTVTNLNYAFLSSAFNSPSISNWDVSHVTTMLSMFNNDPVFNQPLNSWDVSGLTNASSMFYGDTAFNQPLNNWSTAKFTDISGMFSSAAAFNQNIDDWDVSRVTNLQNTFAGASAFNQPLNNWDVSNVTVMASTFASANSFNQPLDSWNTAKVTDMSYMFFNNTAFNQNISGWNVGSAYGGYFAYGAALTAGNSPTFS